MKRLSVRLSLAFLLSAWVGIGAMVLVVQQTVNASFRQYLTTRANEPDPEQMTRLENYYATNGSWEGIETLLSGRGSGGGSGRGATFSIADRDGVIAASTDPAQVGKRLSDDAFETAFPLMQEDTQVGWLFRQTPGEQALGSAEVAFLDESNRWLTIAGIGATFLALVVGSVFAWTLARPLRELTHAVRDLSVGRLGRQVQTRGTVEVEALAAEFNTMSKALAEAETLRQRMAADVAHELRTPVTVLRGYLEAMLDGVYPLDTSHIVVAHDQVIHLAQLVEDLRVLTLAEAKRLPLELVSFDPVSFVNQMMEAFEPLTLDSNIRLSYSIAPQIPLIKADVTRIRQVLSNLLTNALRHTPANGEIMLRVMPIMNGVSFSLTNTGSRLSETESGRVFQPFWRAETARECDSGGSGLGLAISREIITLHGGSIEVKSNGDSVTFTFTLPISS